MENVMLDMTILISELVKAERQKRRDPMADPLEGAEWQGLLWTLRLFDRLGGESRDAKGRQDRSVRSFHQNQPQCSVR
jgi:hypothetical protein